MANLSFQSSSLSKLDLRTYKAPWRGELVLACNKCRKKLKKQKSAKSFANLKKWFKKRAKADDNAPNVRVVGVDCVKMCPRDGITVMRQHQLCDQGNEASIIRSEADLEGLYSLIGATQQRGKLAKTA